MSFEKMMDELRTEYVASIPEKVSEISKHYEAKDFEGLREDFHKLKGTGKTYGIPEISILAELIENLCVNKPTRALEAIPTANQILSEIFRARQAKEPYNIDESPLFIELKKST